MSGCGREKIFFALSLLLFPGILSATSSFKSKTSRVVKVPMNKSISTGRGGEACVHGFCSESDICECNPCWSGPTCQDYVDRFAPRFLAEEPFFILNYDTRVEASSKFSPPYGSRGGSYYTDNSRTEIPLFRIESSDDDLGLTCQLGEVGPSATCPCATPRYAVTGHSSTMFYADPETGDVFLVKGQKLEEGKQYFITLQVSALEVKDAIQEMWKEEIKARLYVRHSVENDKTEATKLLLDYLKFTDLEIDKESEEYSALSPEEAENLYTSHFLSRTRDIRSNSLFRYKRQEPKRSKIEEGDGDRKIQISFQTNRVLWQSFNDEDRIKVGLGIQLPKSNLFLRSNFSIEVLIKNKVKGHLVGISGANITSGRSLLKVSDPSFSHSDDLLLADSVTWNFEKIGLILFDREEIYQGESMDKIQLEVSLSSSQSRLSNSDQFDHFNHVDHLDERPILPESLYLVAQISFPLERKESSDAKVQQIETFIQFPIRRKSSRESGVSAGNGQEKEGKFSPQRNVDKEGREGRPGLEVIGPLEIPRGSRESYIIRLPVRLDLTRELTLSLYQIGNLTQGPISVRDLQLIRAGENFYPASLKRPELRVECTRASSGESGESGEEVTRDQGQLSLEGCSLHIKSLKFLQAQGLKAEEADTTLLEFRGVIDVLKAPHGGIEFQLHVEADVNKGRQDLMMMMTVPQSRPTSRTQQLIDNFTTLPPTVTTPTVVKTVTLFGRVREKREGDHVETNSSPRNHKLTSDTGSISKKSMQMPQRMVTREGKFKRQEYT